MSEGRLQPKYTRRWERSPGGFVSDRNVESYAGGCGTGSEHRQLRPPEAGTGDSQMGTA